MDSVNKTLYIPLYGKSYVSKRGIILNDPTAETIWENEGFELKGKSKSKWLAFYMGMRAAVFDRWVEKKAADDDCIILHIGCGMDSRVRRVRRVPHGNARWYDVDFPDVIAERRKYYDESENYRMIAADARQTDWLESTEKKNAVIIMEGISMYFKFDELTKLLSELNAYYPSINLLIDCYSVAAAKASKYRNPINDVGVTEVYGIDDPKQLEAGTRIKYVTEHEITPQELIDELSGAEKTIFKSVYGGSVAKKMYHLYEFEGNI